MEKNWYFTIDVKASNGSSFHYDSREDNCLFANNVWASIRATSELSKALRALKSRTHVNTTYTFKIVVDSCIPHRVSDNKIDYRRFQFNPQDNHHVSIWKADKIVGNKYFSY